MVRILSVSQKQFVRIDGCDSMMRDLERGAPQGSVPSPLLYSLYTAPLADIAKHQNVRCHFFADDIQLYVSFKVHDASDIFSIKDSVQKCLCDI